MSRSGDTSVLSSSKVSLTTLPSYGRKPSRNLWMMIRAPDARRSSASALLRASASRLTSDANPPQGTAGGPGSGASFRTVPAHPISRSSQCAPRQRTCRGEEARWPRRTLSTPNSLVPGAPDLPGNVAPRVHVIEVLLVLERVEAGPEPLVTVRDQLFVSDEALKRLLDKLLAALEIVEDLPLEGEEAAVDPQVGVTDMTDVPHHASPVHRHRVKGLVRADADEARDLVLAVRGVDITVEGQFRQSIAVVREERGVVREIVPDGTQALADVGLQPRVHERDVPV